MKTFVLLAFVWSTGSPTWQTLEVATDLTGEACIEQLVNGPHVAYDTEGRPVDVSMEELACELEAL